MARVTRVLAVLLACAACGGGTARNGGRSESTAGVGGSGETSAGTAGGGQGWNAAAGAGTSGGGAGGSVAEGGVGGAAEAECVLSSDCMVRSTQCCSCGRLTLETAAAVRAESVESQPPVCPDVGCQCPEPSQESARTLHAACVSGQCVVVDVREKDYTLCQTDADCRLALAWCCGTCFWPPLAHSYAVRADSLDDFRQCPERVSCPAIACDPEPPPPIAEAYCGEDGRCAARPLEAAAGAGG